MVAKGIWYLIHLSPIQLIFTWIKGHADFPGNDTVDTISKWITTHVHIHIHPNHYLPSSTTNIHLQHIPIPSKVTSKHTKHSPFTNITISTFHSAMTSFSTLHGFFASFLNG